MQKIQKFGGAMLTPIMLNTFAGIVIGLGTLFTTEAIFGDLAAKDCIWYKCWYVFLKGGWTVINQLPLLFAVSLPIGLAKKQHARCCMEALVGFLTFHYFINALLSQWGGDFGIDFSADVESSQRLALVASIKTLDMGIFGALGVSAIVVAIHNKYFDKELPVWLGVFNGSVFVYTISFFALLATAVACCFVWPHVQNGIVGLQGFLTSTGLVGVWVFALFEKLLLPFGLHHLLYTPFFFDNVVIPGGINLTWANSLPTFAASTEPIKDLAPWASFACTGWSSVFGCTGIALALYNTAKPERRKQLLSFLVPITLTAILCCITEPLEFTFLFIAPPLFVVHAILGACLATTMNAFGVIGIFSGSLIDMTVQNFIPLMKNHAFTYLIGLIIGLVYVGIYFIVFRTLIIKFDYKTPGREDEESEIDFKSKKDYLDKKATDKTVDGKSSNKSKNEILAENIVELLGGKDNIKDLTNCCTRLRVNVHDSSLVGSDTDFKKIGTSGVSKNGCSMQVIVGLTVPSVREKVEDILQL